MSAEMTKAPKLVEFRGLPECEEGDLNAHIDNEESRKVTKEEVCEKSIESLVTVSGHSTTGSATASSTPLVDTHEKRGVAVAREIPDAVTIAKAIAVLAALGGGQDAAERGRVLADAILEREEVRLALEIRAGGDMALRRSIELAALVLAAAHGGARR